MEVTGAIRRVKFQSNHHHKQTNTKPFIVRMPFLSPIRHCQSTKGKLCRLSWIFTFMCGTGFDTNWSYKRYKAPVKSSLPMYQQSTFYRPNGLPVAQPQCQCTEGSKYHIQWTCTHQDYSGSNSLVLTTKGFWLPSLLSSLWCHSICYWCMNLSRCAHNFSSYPAHKDTQSVSH